MTKPKREIVPGSKYDVPIRQRYRKVTVRDRNQFLQYLEKGKTVREAAEMTGHSPSTFQTICAREPEFKELKEQAMQVGTDVIEEEARRRAVEGWLEPVVGKVSPGIDGQVLGPDGEPMWVRRYSDRLAEVLLKGRRPEYRDSHRVDITNQTLNVTVEDRSAALSEVAKVLREVGASVDDGGGGSGEVISGAGLLVAESEDVHG